MHGDTAYIPLGPIERPGTTQRPALQKAFIGQSKPEKNLSVFHSRSFVRSLLPWAWIVGLLGALLVIIKVYEAKHIITPSQKNQYQFLTTAVILLLGFAFAEAFRDLARSLKDHIIQRFDPSPRQADLVGGFDGLLNVLRLIPAIFTSKWTLGLVAAAWLLILLTAQGAAALLSLTWDIQDGKDYNGTYLVRGSVQVPNISCYFSNKITCPTQIGLDTRAHSFGEMSQLRDCGPYRDFDAVTHSRYDYLYYCQQDRREFALRFNEYNPRDQESAYPHFTSRTLTASSGPCREHKETGYDDETSTYTYAADDGGTNDDPRYKNKITIPKDKLGESGTTYIYRGLAPIQSLNNESWVSCGPRCIYLWAYRNDRPGTPSRFFECPITVSPVSNAPLPEHQIPDDVAKEAAASIALQGQFATNKKKDKNWTQYQFYALWNQWELGQGNGDEAGANMAEFAVGSLATMAQRNPKVEVLGMTPHLGSEISVRWRYLDALLVGIVVVHSLVVLLSYLASRSAPIGTKHGS